MFSSANPFMAAVEKTAEKARDERKPAAVDNPFLRAQEKVSQQFVGALDVWRDSQEALSEAIFLAVYGSPALQAAVGVDPNSTPSRKLEMSPQHRELLQARIAELKSRISQGGLREAIIRGLLYVGMTRGMVDERSLEALRRAKGSDGGPRMTVAEFKAMVREQFFMLLLDRDAALAAIPKLLPKSEEKRRAAFGVIREVLSASAKISGEAAKRLNEIGSLFGIDAGEMPENRPQARAS
jgi:Protein of unknown function (DUF3141)